MDLPKEQEFHRQRDLQISLDELWGDVRTYLLKEEKIRRTKKYQTFYDELRQDIDDYDVWISAGSSSGSFPGFTLEKGLVPIGWMIDGRSQAIPYSGELSRGLTGINSRGVSFDSRDSWPETALRYATSERFNTSGWNPAKGVKEKEQLENSWMMTDPDAKKWAQSRLAIYNKQLETWDKLTPQEQQFVMNPFPVIYAINYRNRQTIEPRLQKLRSEITSEEFVEGTVDADGLTVFCPRERLEEVKGYFKGKNLGRVPVLPIEVLAFLIYSWITHPSITELDTPLDIVGARFHEFRRRFPSTHSFIDALKRWDAKSPIPR